jgi:hypothetical protein
LTGQQRQASRPITDASPHVDGAFFQVNIKQATNDLGIVDDSAAGTFYKRTVSRIQELQSLPAEEQNHVFAILDAFLRYPKTRSAYATS